MRLRTLRLGLIAGLLFGASALAADLPRYKLQPGEILDFSDSSRARSTDGNASGSEGRMRLEVAAAHDDGWRIVYFITSEYWQGGRPKPSTQPATTGEMGVAFLHADGRLDTPPDTYQDVSRFLPPLPATTTQATSGYAVDGLFGSRTIAKVTSSDGPTWVLSIRRDSPENEIYLISGSTDVAFDADRGLPVRIDSSYSQDYGFHEKGTGATRLLSVEQNDAAWAQQLDRDVNAYLIATKKVVADAGQDKPVKDDSTRRSIDTLTAARTMIKTPEILAKLDQRINGLQSPPQRQSEQADQQDKLLNQPMPDWTFDKVGGGKLSLHELRGKVVLLDFWYRGCGWCIRAMPQIKQLSEDYKAKSVAVVGMNVDADEKDAAYVMQKMALTYTVVRTTFESARQSAVFGYPTLIVLDRDGVVRKIDVGYSPDIRHDLTAVIDRLLADKPVN